MKRVRASECVEVNRAKQKRNYRTFGLVLTIKAFLKREAETPGHHYSFTPESNWWW